MQKQIKQETQIMEKKNLLVLTVILVLGLGAYLGYKQYIKSDSGSQAETDSTKSETASDTNLNYSTAQEETKVTTPTTDTATQPVPDTAIAKFETSEGNFKVALNGKAAPLTVANFIKLSNEGFYNGLNFHRIVKGFMIQGGDPQGDGIGGPGYTVPAEIGLKHTKGAIAMARTGDSVNPTKASSGSQFYVTLEATPFLDGQYTVFGYVTEGMDVVEKIGATPTEASPNNPMESSVPLKEIKINKITIEEAK